MTPITRQDILAHQGVAPWAAQYQVEQDLVLCRSMAALFADNFLRGQIAMRGGTLLHKLHLAPASRYSEDIDLVAVGDRPEDHIRRAIRRVLKDLLGNPKTSVWDTLVLALRNAVQPSRVLRMTYSLPSIIEPARMLALVVEANVTERTPHRAVVELPFSFPFRDQTIHAQIKGFDIHEMLGTKMRALFQRKRGRDLFDLYWALTRSQSAITPTAIIESFQHYLQKEGGTAGRAEFLAILDDYLRDRGFCSDMEPLLRSGVIEISDSGRAPKNDPAIFALALVFAHGNVEAKALAFQKLSKVCRIGTHLFHFAEYVNALRGWGRGLRNAVGRWYVSREADALAVQAVKYQQRDGWSHADLLRLAHPKAPSVQHDAVFRWILNGADALGEREVKRKVRGEDRVAKYGAVGELPKLIAAFEQAKRATNAIQVVQLIDEFDLPREAIPTQWLNETKVWEALLERMPMTAMIRNLSKMTSIGLVQPFSDAAKLIVRKLGDEAVLKRARIHPLAVLIAEKVYAQGKGDKGSLTWKPVSKIIDALDSAFYATFQNVEPCGQPLLLALDVSGSMDGSRIAGSCLTAREASAAMALVTAATEPECEIIAFSAPAGGGYGGMHRGGEPGITRVTLSPRMRLDDVIKRIQAIPMGGTDCALPMVWARRNQLQVSGFITYTDSETWAGNIHPAQALCQYRSECVGDAKAVVVGMTSNGFTLADPNDRGMLDVVGFDTTAPAVIADFVRSR